MNLYNFNWSDYDSYEYTILSHRERHSKKQFKDICHKASREVIPSILKVGNGFIGLDTIRRYVVDLLIKKYGFKKADIAFCSFRSCGIIDKEDVESDYRNSGYNECPKEILGEKLFNKVVKYNDNIFGETQ